MVSTLEVYVTVFFVAVVAFAAGITCLSVSDDAHSPHGLRSAADEE